MTPTAPGAFCPDIDRLVRDAVAERPGAGARLDAHAAACPACAAEALLADAPDADLVDALSCLDGTACPPAVAEAALAQARLGAPPRRAHQQASDRAPLARASAPRRTAWARGIGALLFAGVLTLAWARISHEAPPEAPLVAEQTPPAIVPTPVQPEPTPDAVPPSRLAPVAPVPAPQTAPAPEPVVALPPAPARIAEAPPPPTEVPLDLAAAPTPADTAAARADLQVALAILVRANRATEAAVTSEMRRVGEALAPTRIL